MNVAINESSQADCLLRPGNTNCGGCGMSTGLTMLGRALENENYSLLDGHSGMLRHRDGRGFPDYGIQRACGGVYFRFRAGVCQWRRRCERDES